MESLFETESHEYVLQKEAALIAVTLDAYNVSPGGTCDAAAGTAAFKKLLQDPAYREAYGLRLSYAVKNSPLHAAARKLLPASAAAWRRANPKEAYRMARRGLRLAMQSTQPRKPLPPRTAEARVAQGASLRAYWANAPKSIRKRKSLTARKAVTAVWAARSENEILDISVKISKSMKAFNQNLPAEVRDERAAQLAAARANIDHNVRRANQKRALKEYWTADRRAAFGEKVKARNRLKRENDENI